MARIETEYREQKANKKENPGFMDKIGEYTQKGINWLGEKLGFWDENGRKWLDNQIK